MRILRSVLVTGAMAMFIVACKPVVPVVPFTHGQFEGFDTVSYVPAEPRGIVYLFHGAGGSADFADKVESVAVLNWFIDRGYGFMATESTNRSTKQWSNLDPSLITNPDLARLTRLHASLVATTGVDAGTPIVGIGMSNGSAFVGRWGQSWYDAGYPVAAIWMSNSRVAATVRLNGGLTVPGAFTIGANDSIVDNDEIRADYAATAAAGTPTVLYESLEKKLDKWRFLRVEGVDGNEAQAVFDALVATGAWNAAGGRVVPVAEALERANNVTLPASLTRDQKRQVGDQIALVLAEHRFSSEYVASVGAFVEQFVPGP